MTTPSDEPRPGLAGAFRAETLPRWRALLAVGGFGAALLATGGMLEYGSGSPAIQGTPAATYWTLFFALNMLAFGGAALLAGFPRLGRVGVRLAWAASLALVYLLAFSVWYRQQPDGAGALGAWMARSFAYLPAAIATLIGIVLPGRIEADAPSDSAPPP
jgi:hypothetical protein